MKLKNYLLLLLCVLYGSGITGQVVKPFTQRLAGGNLKLKGDVVFVGNNIVNRTTTQPTYDGAGNVTNQATLTAEANTPYNGTESNNFFNFDYIDIDGDASTFSSSSADLAINNSCKRIAYAGLYWTATYPWERRRADETTIPSQNDWNQVQFKLPGGAYQLMVADNAADAAGQEDDIIVDNNTSRTNGLYGTPYVCYKNVTGLLQGLADANGTYTVANQRGQLGIYTSTGSSGGWTLVIIYESPTLPSKFISVYDGYANITGGNVDFAVNGFQTLPAPLPVRARVGVSALEGDYGYTGDSFQIKANSVGGFTPIANVLNPNNNFFNSSITNNDVAVTNRNINSSNTLGFDLDIVQVSNPGTSVIPNNETGATLRLTTGGEAYAVYLATFDVEIIEPSIVLTKTVENTAGVEIGNTDVGLCQDLDYVIRYQNIGNDAAQNFTIRDVLPINVTFNPATDLTLPTGVTYTYDAPTRTIIFSIPNDQVEMNDPVQAIRIRVKTVCSCWDLDDACSNVIQNQAFATYSGVINTAQITDDPSLSSYTTCNVGTAGPSNFLVGLDTCDFTRDVILCVNTVTLTAAPGYTSYTWTGPAPSTAVIGTTQSITVSQVGTYTVHDDINMSPCRSIVETVNVINFAGGALANPVLPYADQTLICPNDGKALPVINLCGATDTRLIQTTISGATSISWEVLNTASCTAVSNTNCANENPSCTWTQVGTGTDYLANVAGQFRVVVNFPDGCNRTFYFNVFQNLLNPIAVSTDIICTTPGTITITNVPAGYEYQMDCTGAWQSSNFFNNVSAGTHTVCIRQVGINDGCIFRATTDLRTRNFTVSTILTQPLCHDGKGCVNIAANDVEPQYTFSIYQGATLVSTAGPMNANSTQFCNLSPGTYNYVVTTEDGCNGTGSFTITNPPAIIVSAAITKPLTCTDGEITVNTVGGTAPYNYVITGAITVTQSSNIIAAPVAGTYNIQVFDNNNCTGTTSITINQNPAPVYTVSQTNILCYGDNTGAINFNMTNANGYTIAYSIDNGLNYIASSAFPNLFAGTYTLIVRYTLGADVCYTTPVTLIITQPAEALTASAGVSELAGCGPSGEGKVRIINPQGGTPAYTYSFDGVNFTGVNEAYLMPGTYTVYIRDINGCTYPMTVTLDPPPTDPTIDVTPPVFNCDGTSTSTVTVNNNGGSFTYTYALDGTLNTPSNNNTFLNVPCGPHTVTVNYQSNTPPTFSNLLFEDFGVGANTTTPGIAPAYCYHDLTLGLPSPCPPTNNPRLEDNQYVVTKAIIPNNGAWFPYRDHTSNGTNPNGRFLAVNIGSAAGPNGVLYSKLINSIIPNQPVIVDVYLANLLRANLVGGSDPSFSFELVDGSGTVVASQTSSNILRSNIWELRQFTLNPGANTTLTFKIRSGSVQYNGNDAAIDDINVYQLPISCITTRNFPINIDCNQAFTAQVTGHNDVSCNGGNNGTITIAAQNYGMPYGYDYTLDGTTWINATISPLTITGLTASTYNVQVRYDNNAANATCSFPFTQVVNEPTVLVSSATVSPATCLTGATITASGSGGTPAYQYQLTDNLGNIIVAYQSSTTFTNIPVGDYLVYVRDANLCTVASTAISVVPPVPPTATIDVSSNYCYTSTGGATLVVNASGGVAPYTYSINGLPAQNSNIFSNLTPNTYTIVVTDSYGCSVTIPAETINNQITLTTSLTKDLDCTASPDAVITGTIAGGYPGYQYQVNVNGGGYGALQTVTGSTFTYMATTSGTYQFQVTDTRGCVVQAGMITINPLSLPEITSVTQTASILCHGDSSASISIVINTAVGTPNYVLNILNTTTGVNYGTATTGLAAGNYTITLTDAKSCIDTETIVITEPAVIAYTEVINPLTCTGSGVSLGSICVNGLTGGTAPFTYTLVDNLGGTANVVHNDATGADYCFLNIDYGSYNLIVTDANGCTLVKSNLLMTSPPNDLDIVITPTVPSCLTGATVTVTVGAPVVGSNYEFGILNSLNLPYVVFPNTFSAPSNPPLTHVFTGLATGAIYTFVVHDITTNCYYFETMTSPTPTNSTLTNTIDVVNNVTCTGSDNGTVSFTFNNYSTTATSVSYVLFDALTNTAVVPAINGTVAIPTVGVVSPITVSNLGPLVPGTYNIRLTENGGTDDGCGITSTNFIIRESATILAITASVSQNDNCNLNAGQIVATATGGTAPYVYQILPSTSPAPIASSAGWVTSNILNAESGNYIAYVKDAYNCIQATAITTLPLDPTPVINASVADACVTQGNYSIDVTMPTAGIAPYAFSLDGGAFVTRTTPFTYTLLNSGTHTIQVRDFNSCGNTVSVTISDPLVAAAIFTTDPICTNSDGEITVTATGGTGNYSYTLLDSASAIIVGPQPLNVFTNQPAGSYIIRIIDTVTNCQINIPLTLALPTAVTFTTVTTPVVCSGASDGTIVVNLSAGNDNPVYTYQITAGPVTTGTQISNSFSGLPAGTYTIEVVSARGCIATDTNVVIGTPTPVSVPSPTITQFGCSPSTNTVNLATITVNGVTGGSGVYLNYQFILGGTILQSGSSNTYSTANTVGGTYTINVYDDKGCLGSTTAVINPYIEISDPTVTVDNAITCATNEDITIGITVNGGPTPTLNYTVAGLNGNTFNVTQNTPSFTGLTVGDYLITVTNPTTGCSVQTIHYVFDPNTFDLLINNVISVTCFGASNGSADITVIDNDLTPTNDAGPFNYSITNSSSVVVASGTSPNAGPLNISGLPSGIYTVNIALTGTPFCSAVKNFTITQPTAALALSTISTPITCVSGNNDGTITASATGGWGTNYQFQLNLGATIVSAYSSNSNFTGLTQGLYTVFVKDERNCIVQTNVNLTNPLPINATVTPSTSLVTCYADCNASISISYPTGGQGSNYSYFLHSTVPTPSDSGPIAIPLGGVVISNLCADTYTVRIVDGWGCEYNATPITISQPAVVEANLSINTTQTCLTDATLTLEGTGGTPPYSYSTTLAGTYTAFAPAGSSTTTITVPVGTHHYYVSDVNGCKSVVSRDVRIDPIVPLTLSLLTHQDILCGGSSTGTITAVANGGLLNYVYTLLDSAGNPIVPAPTQTNPGEFSNLAAGTYQVLVQSVDCQYISGNIIITEPPVFTVSSTPISVKCNGENTGGINLIIAGGTGVVQYAISPNLDQFITIPNPYAVGGFTIPNLTAGTYTVIVQDQNGCFHNMTVIVSEPTALLSSITNVVDESCAEDDLAEFESNMSGGTAPYSVTYTVIYPGTTTVVNGPVVNLAAGISTHTFTNLNGGYYTVYVTDANGCVSENDVNIGSGVSYTPEAVITFPCVSNLPAIEVEVVNLLNTPSLDFDPLGDYLFSLDVNNISNAQASNIFTSATHSSLLVPGTHTVYVFNTLGCNKATSTFTITASDLDALTLVLNSGGLNEIVAVSTGGSGGNTYTFEGNNNGSDNTYVYNQSGNYTVTVTDSSGCFKTVTAFFPFIPIQIDNVFTPNGNGTNDSWGPKNTANYKNLVTKVYDRYGRMIKEMKEGEVWDGKYKGQELPSGDYWYVIKVDDSNDKEYVGHFTLYR